MTGELFGFISTGFLAICAAPQALKCIKTGTANDLSASFLWLWFFGEIFLIPYAIYLDWALPILLNALFNLIMLFTILKYYYFPRGYHVRN